MNSASPPLIDEQVRELVRRSGLSETLFVEAGAGSGKTTLLVDRIVNLVLDQHVPLAAIAAITFTEAAAAELRARIRARFEQELLEAQRSGGHQRASLCSRALEDADIAAVTDLESPMARYRGVDAHACDDDSAERLWELSDQWLAEA